LFEYLKPDTDKAIFCTHKTSSLANVLEESSVVHNLEKSHTE